MKMIVSLIILALLALFVYRGVIEANPLEQQFREGKATEFPDGFWKGSSPTISTGSWLGKEFHADTKTGFNVFDRSGTRSLEYPFTMYATKGARNTDMDVIKIDYNRPENPWYLRYFGYDEIVKLADGRYLGKIQFSLGGVPFTVGWFWQEKQ